MAITWQWNNFKMAMSGDALRQLAGERGLFLYPYDILTGSDLVMLENIKVKDPKQKFIVCAVMDMKETESKEGQKIYAIETSAIMWDWDRYCADTYEGAIALWNKRMKKMARNLQRPPWQRFLCIEYPALGMNVFLWGVLFLILALSDAVSGFYHEHYLCSVLLFLLLCSNIKNIFLKSYGEEIPRSVLQSWAEANIRKFDRAFYEKAMQQRAARCEQYENSVPLYLLWKRGKLRAEDAEPVEDTAEAEDMTCRIFCQEIRETLQGQIDEIRDQRTKITSRTVKRYVEDILSILQEIRQAIAAAEDGSQILSVRRIVSYWNAELITLLRSYTELLQNSSDEAADTKENIEAILKDLYPVYKKELGRITRTQTMEIDAALTIMRSEIDQILDRRS